MKCTLKQGCWYRFVMLKRASQSPMCMQAIFQLPFLHKWQRVQSRRKQLCSSHAGKSVVLLSACISVYEETRLTRWATPIHCEQEWVFCRHPVLVKIYTIAPEFRCTSLSLTALKLKLNREGLKNWYRIYYWSCSLFFSRIGKSISLTLKRRAQLLQSIFDHPQPPGVVLSLPTSAQSFGVFSRMLPACLQKVIPKLWWPVKIVASCFLLFEFFWSCPLPSYSRQRCQ